MVAARAYGLFALVYGPTGQRIERWVRRYNPDAIPPEPSVFFTLNPSEALQFDSIEAARACWIQQSSAIPFRDDGEPNRPLTAFETRILPIPVMLDEAPI